MPSRPTSPPIRRAEHVARKPYPCDDPDHRGCQRQILAGDLYVQLSWPHHGVWTIVRCCSLCRPPTEGSGPRPCPIAPTGSTCTLTADHPGPHEYQEPLFT